MLCCVVLCCLARLALPYFAFLGFAFSCLSSYLPSSYPYLVFVFVLSLSLPLLLSSCQGDRAQPSTPLEWILKSQLPNPTFAEEFAAGYKTARGILTSFFSNETKIQHVRPFFHLNRKDVPKKLSAQIKSVLEQCTEEEIEKHGLATKKLNFVDGNKVPVNEQYFNETIQKKIGIKEWPNEQLKAIQKELEEIQPLKLKETHTCGAGARILQDMELAFRDMYNTILEDPNAYFDATPIGKSKSKKMGDRFNNITNAFFFCYFLLLFVYF